MKYDVVNHQLIIHKSRGLHDLTCPMGHDLEGHQGIVRRELSLMYDSSIIHSTNCVCQQPFLRTGSKYSFDKVTILRLCKFPKYFDPVLGTICFRKLSNMFNSYSNDYFFEVHVWIYKEVIPLTGDPMYMLHSKKETNGAFFLIDDVWKAFELTFVTKTTILVCFELNII